MVATIIPSREEKKMVRRGPSSETLGRKERCIQRFGVEKQRQNQGRGLGESIRNAFETATVG